MAVVPHFIQRSFHAFLIFLESEQTKNVSIASRPAGDAVPKIEKRPK